MLLFQTIEATKGIGKSLFSNLLWLAKNKQGDAGHAKNGKPAKDLDLDTIAGTDKLGNVKLGLAEIAYLLMPEQMEKRTVEHDDALDDFLSQNKIGRKKISTANELESEILKYTEHHHDKTNGTKYKGGDRDNYITDFLEVLSHHQNYRNLRGAQRADAIKALLSAVKAAGGFKKLVEAYVEAKKDIVEDRYRNHVLHHQINKYEGHEKVQRRIELAEEFLKGYQALLPEHLKKKKKQVSANDIQEEVPQLVSDRAAEIYKHSLRYMKDEPNEEGHGRHGHGSH
ncbi:hypothetical protein HYY69_01300 [Candidatus Woesearchaeota archaeon]|nr:hypothetical protein [Candidatus Woesearchaeota archaeon]